jgi:sugar (pentulose or hexulose) kinase
MMAGGASAADVCHKPATRLTFEPDPALAAGLGAAHERWRQIYRQLQD